MNQQSRPPELPVPERLKYLLDYCEKGCVAACCGINAFDFSPIHIASYITAHTGAADEGMIGEWLELVTEFEKNYESIRPAGDGLVCVISSMNQFFTDTAIRALFEELRTSLKAAPSILEFSRKLEAPVKTWEIMDRYTPPNGEPAK